MQVCRACGCENRARAKFCVRCGGRFALRCGSCGAELPEGARFCDECGTPVPEAQPSREGASTDPARSPRAYTPEHLADRILTSRSALEGERKQVTVLFADCVGSTSLAEQLDPEDVREIFDGGFRIMAEEVHRYEGTVNQFTGDGVMALFGAPLAHEDAPERAVRAALGMQAALTRYGEKLKAARGIDFRVRVGINTGLVVVGKIGDDLSMEYSAVGDTTNLAARLQTEAPPGGILISDKTARLVDGRFVLRACGPLRIKGKREPVAAHEVLRALPRVPLVAPSSERGLTPLIGRDADLAALEVQYRRVAAGQGQAVFVTGEAGIGKSRLMYEFRRRLPVGELTWLEGRCISFGSGMPFLPVIDALKSLVGIEESDGDAGMIEKLDSGLAAAGSELSASAPYLRALLALPVGDAAVETMDAGTRRFATFEALKQLLLANAKTKTVVILIEDLHWLDPASEEFLTYIIDAVAHARILLVCTHRPGYQSPLGDRSYFHRLSLQPLPSDEAATMVARILTAQNLPEEVSNLITSKTEGNPFFVEEVTSSLLELGALSHDGKRYVLDRALADAAIPNRIQDVIMARIDRLGDEPKHAMQVASVIGREFAIRLLQRASEAGDEVHALVGELKSLELIYEKSGVPELAYMFKHALTHDVAYESLLLQHRRRLHDVIGTAIEELYADRLAEYWETLAHHFSRAERFDKAFGYLLKAGDKARLAYANHEAALFYGQALEIAGKVGAAPAERAAILRNRAWVLMCTSRFPESADDYRQALALTSDPRERAGMLTYLGVALWYGHEFDEALAVAAEAEKYATSAKDRPILGEARAVVGLVELVRGELENSAKSMAESARLMKGASIHPIIAPWVESSLGLYDNWRGDYATAIERFEPLVGELKTSNQLFSLAQASSHYAITLAGAGRYADALAWLDEGVRLTESIGDRFWRARMWNTRGWILGELGAFDEADESNRRCLEVAKQLGSLRMVPELIGNAACNLADVAIARGDFGAANAHLVEVGAILADGRNEWMTWRYRMHYEAAAAGVALAAGDLASARRLIAACLAAARKTKSRRYVVRAARLQACVAVAAGEAKAAAKALDAVAVEARGLRNPPQLWATMSEQASVLAKLGRTDDARAAAAEGLTSLDAVAKGLSGELRAVLLGTSIRDVLGNRAG